jgi:DNA-binding GntR family transcriptional regulator
LIEIIGVTRTLREHLREQIITGELAPGKRINEIELSSDLGTSRSPLREALRILETERLIVNIPRKGSYITELSLEDFFEVCQVREMIEFYAIDLMKEKNIRDLSHVASILKKKSNSRMPSPDAPTEVKLEYIANSRRYHAKLVESSGNNNLIQFYRTIYYSIQRYQFFYAFISGITDDGERDHREVLEWLMRGQYAKAKKCLKGHIRFFVQKMNRKMAS